MSMTSAEKTADIISRLDNMLDALERCEATLRAQSALKRRAAFRVIEGGRDG